MVDFILVGLHLKDKSSVIYTVNKVLELSNNGEDYSFNGDGNISAFEYACDVYFMVIGFKLFDLNNLEFIDIGIEDAFSLNIEGLYLSALDKGKEEILMNLFGLSLCGRVKYGIEDGEFFNPLYEHISRNFYKMSAIRVLDIPSLMVEDISEEEYFRDKPVVLGLDYYITSFNLNLLGFDSYDRFDFFIFTGGLCNIYPVIYDNELVTSFSSLLPDFDFNHMLVRTKIKTKDVSSIDLFLRIDNRNKNVYLSSLYNPIIGDFCYNKSLLYFYDVFISFNDFRESAEFNLYEFISDNTIIIGDTSFTYGREFDLILPIGIVKSEFSFLRKDSVCKVVFPPTLNKISLDALNTMDVSFILSKSSLVNININLGDGYIELKGNSANASFIKELEKLRIHIDFY